MIRIICYVTIFILSVVTSFAQLKTEEVNLNNGVIQLPGTLSYTVEKSPLLIWVHGSGGVDRDGNPAKYIQQFREAVNKQNLAFFSYDKRTANPKNAAFLNDVLIDDFVSDIEVVISHFKNDVRFSSIILVGHSQGSLLAMMASKNVDKYISVAGAGETIDKTIIRQITNQNAAFGEMTAQHFKELKETGSIKEVNPNFVSLFAPQNLLFISSWMALNPVDEIKKVSIPTLIIQGDKDIQVLISDAENLSKAKPDAQFAFVKNMNHVLKTIEKDEDNLASYMSDNFSISKEFIKVITNFVLQK
ncbi:alpha/beta hydrolase family protein [Polaribacter gangjinensis]|uniref:Alpha/beta hydrolase n=1 Tax=Polaribacter gangjinensis TaxID=574710 RepID=A0A2S7W9E4_9FLAO|nr:alpha/beta hydrolase [Polaribacter gangjinensis]PQJ74203.1 alpha/beta hydrolase [Polaribacter gangjinensis]